MNAPVDQSGPLKTYRASRVGRLSRVVSSETFRAATDAAAMQTARRFASRHRVALFEGERFVGSVQASMPVGLYRARQLP